MVAVKMKRNRTSGFRLACFGGQVGRMYLWTVSGKNGETTILIPVIRWIIVLFPEGVKEEKENDFQYSCLEYWVDGGRHEINM